MFLKTGAFFDPWQMYIKILQIFGIRFSNINFKLYLSPNCKIVLSLNKNIITIKHVICIILVLRPGIYRKRIYLFFRILTKKFPPIFYPDNLSGEATPICTKWYHLVGFYKAFKILKVTTRQKSTLDDSLRGRKDLSSAYFTTAKDYLALLALCIFFSNPCYEDNKFCFCYF